MGLQQGSFHPASPESIEWYWVWFWIKGIFKKIIHLLFDSARSLLLPRLFSSCGEQGLLCSCGVRSSYCGGFSFYRAWALMCTRASLVAHVDAVLWFSGSRAQAPWLWCMGLVAPWHVGSSWIRDPTHVSCSGRWSLFYWVIRECRGARSGCRAHSML